METILSLWIFYFLCLNRISDTSTFFLTTPQHQSSCGSWIPYTDEKCLRIADIAAFQTKQEADAVCPTFSEVEVLDDIPRLVTVKSEMEQKALKQFLFEELGLLDHVWLDVDISSDGIFRWNNESELYFNNLVEQNVTGTDRQCIQIESGQGIYPMGKWARVNCRKRNVVVCEKTQVWTVAQLQNRFLSFKSKVERQIETARIIPGKEVEALTKTGRIIEKTPDIEETALHQSPCGDWTSYKDEKCVKLIFKSGTQMKEDADAVCQSLKEFWDPETIPHLVTVKTQEKQKFLQQLLFEKQTTFDHVWLGLELENDTLFRWNDGTDVFFSNWAKQDNVDPERRCVQMESGEGVYESGQWARTNCKKRNAVVCEKTQTWTVTRLQNILLSLKLDVERNRKQSEETLLATKQEAERKLNAIKQEAEAKMSANKREVEQAIKTVKQEAELKINTVKQEAEQKINAAKQEADRKINANKAEAERTFNAFKQETEGKLKAADTKIALAKQEAEQKISNLVKNPATSSPNLPCDDWIPYKDEKCIKLAELAGHQTKEDAEIVCQSFAEELRLEDVPTLVNVKTKEKQEFLQKALFADRITLDNIWLGLDVRSDGAFRWNDGAEVFYTNWAKQNTTDKARHCTQMGSGEGAYEAGSWVRVNCQKKNAIVCERTQVWSVAKLKNILLSLMLALENTKKVAKENLQAAKQEADQNIQAAKEEADQKIQAAKQEADQKIKESYQKIKEADQKLQAVKQEAVEKIQAAKEEADQKIKETNQNIQAAKQEFDQKIKETDKKMQAVKQEAGQKIQTVKQEADQKIKDAKQEADQLIKNVKQEADQKITDVKQAAEQKINTLSQDVLAVRQETNRELDTLKRNQVPVGFVYVQLPGQQPPSSIWPQTKWTDVSSQYAGNFFRVVGGKAAPFGQVQSGSSPSLEQVNTMWDAPYKTTIQVPTDGTWSPGIITAKFVSAEHSYSLRFLQSNPEVRPQNQAVIVWQRSK